MTYIGKWQKLFGMKPFRYPFSKCYNALSHFSNKYNGKTLPMQEIDADKLHFFFKHFLQNIYSRNCIFFFLFLLLNKNLRYVATEHDSPQFRRNDVSPPTLVLYLAVTHVSTSPLVSPNNCWFSCMAGPV